MKIEIIPVAKLILPLPPAKMKQAERGDADRRLQTKGLPACTTGGAGAHAQPSLLEALEPVQSELPLFCHFPRFKLSSKKLLLVVRQRE
jgi:hypothetical protein